MSKKQPPVCAPAHLSPAEQAVSEALLSADNLKWCVQDAREQLAMYSAQHHDALVTARAAMVAASLDHVVYMNQLVSVRGGSAGVEPSLSFLPAPRVLGGAA